jgi:hypothetical protein
MVRKFPDKQWNRQNSILFHETIPLKPSMVASPSCWSAVPDKRRYICVKIQLGG